MNIAEVENNFNKTKKLNAASEMLMLLNTYSPQQGDVWNPFHHCASSRSRSNLKVRDIGEVSESSNSLLHLDVKIPSTSTHIQKA